MLSYNSCSTSLDLLPDNSRSVIIRFGFIFKSGWVTAGAVTKIANGFVTVFCRDLSLVVVVTAIASIGRQVLVVAGLAGAHASLAVIDRECVQAVILSWRPGLDAVTAHASRIEETQVVAWLGVAGAARCRCPSEHACGVTILARDR